MTEEVPAEDGTTTEVESQQTFTVYTVAYAGEDYFGDTVWALTKKARPATIPPT